MRKLQISVGVLAISAIVVASAQADLPYKPKHLADEEFQPWVIRQLPLVPIQEPSPDIIKDVPKPSISERPEISVKQQTAKVETKTTTKASLSGRWVHDPEISWYGPCCYGNRTACGFRYTRQILGVAHRTLPCGTKVTFKYKNKAITVPVIDRGPYVSGRQWDMSAGLCLYLDHCFTGPIDYRIEG